MRYAAIFVVLLAGCEKPIAQWRADDFAPLTNVEGLRDCVYVSIPTGARLLHVIRCPNSDVAVGYKQGKANAQSNTVTP